MSSELEVGEEVVADFFRGRKVIRSRMIDRDYNYRYPSTLTISTLYWP